jgi:hypothetical protein
VGWQSIDPHELADDRPHRIYSYMDSIRLTLEVRVLRAHDDPGVVRNLPVQSDEVAPIEGHEHPSWNTRANDAGIATRNAWCPLDPGPGVDDVPSPASA